MHHTHRLWLGIILALIVSIFLVALWLLSVSGTLCLSLTNGNQIEEYSADPAQFKESVSRVRDDAFSSLVKMFNPETGFFVYSLHPSGMSSVLNNDIRQLLASRALALRALSDDTLRALHEQNIGTIIEKWYREEDGVGYVYAYEKSKLGANAMLLRTLVASPFYEKYEREAEHLVLGIKALQNNDGSFKPWFKEPTYEYDYDNLLTFYSGEAILALLEYSEKTGDKESYNIAKRAQDFYIGEYIERMSENYYPAYVPWHTLSLAHFYRKTGETRYSDALFRLTDKLLEIQDTTEFVGRFYNPETPEYGSPHASSDAVYTEGLAVAYEVAKEVGDSERESRYHEALVQAFSNIESLQFTPKWYRVFDDTKIGEQLRGGIQTNVCESNVRIDSTAHTVDALTTLESALE
jgi:hypothetical protein